MPYLLQNWELEPNNKTVMEIQLKFLFLKDKLILENYMMPEQTFYMLEKDFGWLMLQNLRLKLFNKPLPDQISNFLQKKVLKINLKA